MRLMKACPGKRTSELNLPILDPLNSCWLYSWYIGIMEKKIETTMYWGMSYIVYRKSGDLVSDFIMWITEGIIQLIKVMYIY